MTKTHAKQPITEENEMEWELTCVSHGPHDDSHGSLARNLSRLLSFYLGNFFSEGEGLRAISSVGKKF